MHYRHDYFWNLSKNFNLNMNGSNQSKILKKI